MSYNYTTPPPLYTYCKFNFTQVFPLVKDVTYWFFGSQKVLGQGHNALIIENGFWRITIFSLDACNHETLHTSDYDHLGCDIWIIFEKLEYIFGNGTLVMFIYKAQLGILLQHI